MTAFKIGGAPPQPMSEISKSKKKPEAAAPEESAAAPKGSFDTAAFRPFVAMPRMGTAGGKEAERTRSAAVESLLRDSSEEIDDYFASAYGFKE